MQNKTFQETDKSLRKFFEPSEKPKVIYTDNSLEFRKSCEDLSWNHRTSAPHRSETNGIAEREARKIKEGTFAVLLQWSLDEKMGGLIQWNASAICDMSMTSWQTGKLLMKGDSENHLKAQSFRLVQWLSIIRFSSRDQSRRHQFGKTVLPGIFLGCALVAVGI